MDDDPASGPPPPRIPTRTDLVRIAVVRIADEVVVDILAIACGVPFAEVADQVEIEEIEGVPVRFLTAAALIRTKQSLREKDAIDRHYLEQLLER